VVDGTRSEKHAVCDADRCRRHVLPTFFENTDWSGKQ